MSQPTVSTDLFQSLQIFTEFAVQTVGEDLVGFSIHNVTLSVQEPGWDLELGWILNDRHNSLQFVGVQFTGTTCMLDLVIVLGTHHGQ